MTQMLLGISPEWKPLFDNFVVGRNVELLSVLNDGLNKAPDECCVYIWGEASGGKTHLLQATIAQAHVLGKSAVYARSEVPELAEIVAVDDVEQLDDAQQIELFAMYNRQRENGGLLLVSGLSAPAHLVLRDDLRTRLGWGLVYQVQPLNDEEKAMALHEHANARGLELSSDVTQYLLRHGRRDLPSLLGVLDALDEHCLRLKRSASVPLLKEVMQKI